jgi:hypothetical protein
MAEVYARPNPELFRDEPTGSPSAFLVKSDEDYVSIIRQMHGLGMASFTTSPKVINGLFGAKKSDGLLRLLVDGRPTNNVWAPPPETELPSPELLSKLEVPVGERVFVCKSDLDNYYHRLKTPDWMWPYFALPPVRASDVGLCDLPPDTLVYPCLTTLPMGWSHAAALAQAAHEYIVDSSTSLVGQDRLTRAGDFRLDRPRHMIYIDDFAGVCLERDRARLEAAQREYGAVLAGKAPAEAL